MLTEEEAALVLAGKRILIVEDEGLIQMHLRRILTRAGLLVLGAATNGKEGVELALQEKPDLILMDINMPIMNGLEATRLIHASLTTCVVMVTAYVDEDYRQQARDAGAQGYLLKPVSASTLLPTLASVYKIECAPVTDPEAPA